MNEPIVNVVGLFACLLASSVASAGAANEVASKLSPRLVCVGRVEPVDGEVEVCAQMSGTLTAVRVREGDWVTNGTVLAEVDACREEAALKLALARLARVKAGTGREEISAAEASRDAIAAELAFADSELRRTMRLRASQIVAEDELERRQQSVDMLRKRMIAAEKQWEALKRGPLPEEVAVAEAEAAAAQAAYDLRFIRAQADGVILELRRHAGDFVAVNYPTPVLRMANTRKLHVRLEINEQDAGRMRIGMQGSFTAFGTAKPAGELLVKTILPAFAPRRLFEPDSTARLDTRTLRVLCEVAANSEVFAGQRVTAVLLSAGQSE